MCGKRLNYRVVKIFTRCQRKKVYKLNFGSEFKGELLCYLLDCQMYLDSGFALFWEKLLYKFRGEKVTICFIVISSFTVEEGTFQEVIGELLPFLSTEIFFELVATNIDFIGFFEKNKNQLLCVLTLSVRLYDRPLKLFVQMLI